SFTHSDGIFILAKKKQWDIVEWGMMQPVAENEKSYFLTEWCVHGYVSGTFEEVQQALLKLEKQWNDKGYEFVTDAVLVESFYIGDAKDAVTISQFYIGIEEKN
ncbi:MAG: hypothetical protein ACRCWQ_02975, partial [Bacilli bacterium]